MKRKTEFTIIGVLAVLMTLVTACSPAPQDAQEPTNADNMAGLANPAAVYCEGLGYIMETVERNGGEDADCVFPDGSRCAQWDFLAGRCGQAFSYCEQQGGVMEEGGNIGICRFSDGSYCDEYTFFSGECAPGDNTVASAAGEDEEAYPVEDETAQESINIQSMEEARDYMAITFANKYGVEISEPWVESDVTIDDTTASTTVRYVSGSLTIVISSMASAPAVNYTIEEASDIANGFYFRGTLKSDGTVIVEDVNLRGTILTVENARDAVLAYLAQTYAVPSYDDWTDNGSSQGSIDDRPTTVRTFSASTWVVTVEFEPTAPLVGVYMVNVENNSGDFSWEGQIDLYGKITENSSSH